MRCPGCCLFLLGTVGLTPSRSCPDFICTPDGTGNSVCLVPMAKALGSYGLQGLMKGEPLANFPSSGACVPCVPLLRRLAALPSAPAARALLAPGPPCRCFRTMTRSHRCARAFSMLGHGHGWLLRSVVCAASAHVLQAQPPPSLLWRLHGAALG